MGKIPLYTLIISTIIVTISILLNQKTLSILCETSLSSLSDDENNRSLQSHLCQIAISMKDIISIGEEECLSTRTSFPSSDITNDGEKDGQRKKKNPIKHFFSRLREQRKGKKVKKRLKKELKRSKTKKTMIENTADRKTIRLSFPKAFSPLNTKLTPIQKNIVQSLSKRAHESIPNFDSRIKGVSWGGSISTKWFDYDNNGRSTLLEGYLRIMQWPNGDLTTIFPFKLCKNKKECPKEFALQHSLEWREDFKPWCISSITENENQKGYFYLHGYSPSYDDSHDNKGHALVWYRSGIHRYQNATEWIRLFVHTLDRAVADTLIRTDGKVGRFNAIIDAGQFSSLSEIPPFTHLKGLITILQDHFPDRLGVVFLLNFSKPAQFIFGLIKPLISKEVRQKIIMVPNDDNDENNKRRQELLNNFISPEFLPKSLGGSTDEYKFDHKLYYQDSLVCE